MCTQVGEIVSGEILTCYTREDSTSRKTRGKAASAFSLAQFRQQQPSWHDRGSMTVAVLAKLLLALNQVAGRQTWASLGGCTGKSISAVTFFSPQRSSVSVANDDSVARPEDSNGPWANLLDVSKSYDALLLDMFGVIHDGSNPYPDSPEMLQSLLDAGKTIAVLSNSPRRKAVVQARLAKMGFPAVHYIVTSGELVWNLFYTRPGAPFDDALGRRCVMFGSGGDDVEYVTSAGMSIADVSNADFLFARGLRCIEDTTEDKVYTAGRVVSIMSLARKRDLPMIVANPDLAVPDGSPMPGVIAKMYEDMGGTVHYVGKPHSMVYQNTLDMLQRQGVHANKVAAVGDSLMHDVRGAQQAGIDAIFVASGIHHGELDLHDGRNADSVQFALDNLFQEYIHRDSGIFRPPEHTVYKFADFEA